MGYPASKSLYRIGSVVFCCTLSTKRPVLEAGLDMILRRAVTDIIAPVRLETLLPIIAGLLVAIYYAQSLLFFPEL